MHDLTPSDIINVWDDCRLALLLVCVWWVCASSFFVDLYFEKVTIVTAFCLCLHHGVVKSILTTFICGLRDPSDKPDWHRTKGEIWYCALGSPYLLAVY